MTPHAGWPGGWREVPSGQLALVDHLTARQQWAVGACVGAGLELHPTGPICWRGQVGPLAPYMPTGAFL